MQSSVRGKATNKPQQVLSVILINLLLAGSAAADVVRLSEPVASDAHSETFGQVLNENLPRLGLIELLNEADQHLGQTVLVDTHIGKVCQKKGCFFIATEGAAAVRVSFRDYGFFVPSDSSGKMVTLAGQLVRKAISAEQAEHFNQDMQAQGTLRAGEVYELVADGVRIPL